MAADSKHAEETIVGELLKWANAHDFEELVLNFPHVVADFLKSKSSPSDALESLFSDRMTYSFDPDKLCWISVCCVVFLVLGAKFESSPVYNKFTPSSPFSQRIKAHLFAVCPPLCQENVPDSVLLALCALFQSFSGTTGKPRLGGLPETYAKSVRRMHSLVDSRLTADCLIAESLNLFDDVIRFNN